MEAISRFLASMGISLDKIVGFASDGASVMMGKHNGVATLFSRIFQFTITTHCVSHRYKFHLYTYMVFDYLPELCNKYIQARIELFAGF